MDNSTTSPYKYRRLIIESPYAGNIKRNVAFARTVCHYAVLQGYSPYASHLLLTQFLDDDRPNERDMGIDAGLAWGEAAEEVWFCLRPEENFSRGMKYALKNHMSKGRTFYVKRFTQEGEFLYDECPFCSEPNYSHICPDCAASSR